MIFGFTFWELARLGIALTTAAAVAVWAWHLIFGQDKHVREDN